MTHQPVRLYASLTPADPLCLGEHIDALLAAGVDGLHLDIADGVFVPDITFGLRVVRAVARRAPGAAEVHLMVADPEPLLRELGSIGRFRVAVHLEAVRYPWRIVSLARKVGHSVGAAINPGTPVSALEPVASAVDFVTMLTTEPDFAGEHFLPGSTARIAAARAILPADVAIEADGGITPHTIRAVVDAGASAVVVGRALATDRLPRRGVLALRSRLAAAS